MDAGTWIGLAATAIMLLSLIVTIATLFSHRIERLEDRIHELERG
jgi:hypothetical protein